MLAWIVMSKLRAALSLILSIGMGIYIGFGIGHWDGVGDGKDIEKLGQYKKSVEVMEKRNEIRNNRPDTDKFFERLWSDRNW